MLVLSALNQLCRSTQNILFNLASRGAVWGKTEGLQAGPIGQKEQGKFLDLDAVSVLYYTCCILVLHPD